MSVTDEKEYGTGDSPNPADIAAQIPRKEDWSARMLADRQRQLEGSSWYPVATGAPETTVPKRYKAFDADEGSFQASITPQKWDCTNLVNVPQNGGAAGNPVEVVPYYPGRDSLTIVNTGANPVILSPNIEAALNGRGITVPANGGTFSMSTQAGFWAWATGGNSTVQAYWTAYEAPTSHLPPKPKEE